MKSISKIKQDLSHTLDINLDEYFELFKKMKDVVTEDTSLLEIIQNSIITQKQYHEFISDSIAISKEISIDELFNSLLTPAEGEFPFWSSIVSVVQSSLKNNEKIRKLIEIKHDRIEILELILNTTMIERDDDLPQIEGFDDDLIEEIITVLRWSIDLILLGRFSFPKYSLRAKSNLGLNEDISKEIYDLIKRKQDILTRIAIIEKIGVISNDVEELKEVFEDFSKLKENDIEE